MNLLIDTNIIIDALASREPWSHEAEKLFLSAANQMADMYITASSATDIYYILRKYLHDEKKTRKVMENLYELFGILTVTGKDCMEALISSVIKDYEDAVVEQVARVNEMDYIVTRNLKDYENSICKVIFPKDVLVLLEAE